MTATKPTSYKTTIAACYIGNFVQATVINLTPVLFIPLKEQFHLTYSQFGILILANFITQVIFDIVFSKPVDKYGFRVFTVTAHIVCVLGFVMFALTPYLFKGNEFTGFFISTIVFSGAGGLLELVLSPVIDAIPSDEKDKAMSLMHSFYAWGQITVVLVTTLFLYVFKNLSFSVIVLFWTIIPFINIFFFLKAPLHQKVHESGAMKIRKLIVTPIFIFAFFAIVFGGASEVVMAQWSSAFMEKGLMLPKVAGDILGMCGFALMLGIGRLVYGLYGHKFNLNNVMIVGSLLAIFCYITVALTSSPIISLIACALSGICVSLLWPGTLVVASKNLPLAGASMFALLSAGGDIGASVGPWLTGVITDYSNTILPSEFVSKFQLTQEQFGLRAGILIASIFPLLCLIFHIILKKREQKTDLA